MIRLTHAEETMTVSQTISIQYRKVTEKWTVRENFYINIACQNSDAR